MKRILVITILFLSVIKVNAQTENLTLEKVIDELNNSRFMVNLSDDLITYRQSNNWSEVKLYQIVDFSEYKIYTLIYDDTLQSVNELSTYIRRRPHVVIYSKKHKKYFFIHFYGPSIEELVKHDEDKISIKYDISDLNGFVYEFVLTDDLFLNKNPIKINFDSQTNQTNYEFYGCEEDYKQSANKNFMCQNIDNIIDFILLNINIESINDCSDLDRLYDLQWKLPYYLRNEEYRNY